MAALFRAQHVQTSGEFLSTPPDGPLTFDADGCKYSFRVTSLNSSSRSAQETMMTGGFYRANVSGIVSRRLGARIADIEILSVSDLLDVTDEKFKGLQVRALQSLVGGLPADVGQAQKVFDRRVKAAFAVGADEEGVVDGLARKTFQINRRSPDGFRMATLTKADGICQEIWSVRWTAKAGKISQIWGVYGLTCP